MNDMEFIVTSLHDNERADIFLSLHQDEYSRSALAKLFDSDMVLVNGIARPKKHKLKTGDTIAILPQELTSDQQLEPQDIPLEIVFEDDDILVINKPKGMTVHPVDAAEKDTLVNALLHHLGENISTIGAPLRPGIVHRIDKDTSGLLVVAKTNDAHRQLTEQVEAHTMKRVYEGVVIGRIKTDSGTINLPIGRDHKNRTKNCVRDDGRQAVTHYSVIKRFRGHSHVEFVLETGRMHQIRVHMAYMQRPLAGDAAYGKPIKSLAGQCLHAKTLGFIHPKTNEYIEFCGDAPKSFTDFIAQLEEE